MLLLVIHVRLLSDFIARSRHLIFTAIIKQLTQVGNSPRAHGRGHHHHAGVSIDHAATGCRCLIASKFVGVPFTRAMFRSSPLIHVFYPITIAFTVLFPDVVLWLRSAPAAIVGCFPNPAEPAGSAPSRCGPKKIHGPP